MKAKELSSFCMQIAFLLGAGLSIDTALLVLAEDAERQGDKALFTSMSEDVEVGIPLADTMAKAGQFPDYLIQMTRVGQQTGNLEIIMESLSNYYEKESSLAQTIKNALTYPLIMVTMLMVVLFVLLTKVMPVFEEVYRQLGAQLSPITKSAVQIGTIFSGAVIVVILLLLLLAAGVMVSSRKGKGQLWAEHVLQVMKEKSGIAGTLAKRRLSAVLAISLKSGLEIESGMGLALALVSQKKLQDKLLICKEQIERGESLYDSLKKADIFSGLDMQMIKVGVRSGKADAIFDKLAKKYEEEVDTSIDNMILRFEPTMVVILASVVGLILLSVMMPLVGIMASIG
ncbi:type II secretion system F family protein [Aminipila butyrica]|uniref:Type II secretion system F family protein n=1 Tax=Aminipila butyrica TaxID=433296 RepID=A0A858BTI0_9FIRM|nr:type II secretion system F family protein [Aminipila butyrica]QIB68499.1 type II secretion system F family protein [Aminipila butyrica]